MDLGIAGRRAIVCASSRGIGKACAVALANEGVSVVMNGRDRAALEAAAAEVRALGGGAVTPVVADITTAEGQAALLAACPAPDILVNNNGGPGYFQYQDVDRELLMRGLILNMVTPIELVRAVIDGMAERGFGRIVNITSVSVKMPVPGLDVSSGARAGLTAYLAGVARRVIERNVTINHVLPGYVDTDRFRTGIREAAAKGARSEAAIESERRDLIPARRFARPDEIGSVCAYLCSALAGYITAQNVVIDGAWYASAF